MKYAALKQLNHDGLMAFGGAIKALNDTGLIELPLCMFGDPAHKDLTGQYFTPETDFHWEGKEKRPHLYHHGLDPEMGLKYLGDGLTFSRIDEFALWAKSQLDLSDRYEAFLFEQAKAGRLGCSSGTAPHMIKAAADGRLLDWPIVEGSSTFSPIDPRSKGLVQPIKSFTVVTPLKALMIDSDPATGTGPGAPGQVRATSKADRKIIAPLRLRTGTRVSGFTATRASLKSLPGATTMNKQAILDAIAKFVPAISPEDADKLADLILLMANVAGEPAEPAGDTTDPATDPMAAMPEIKGLDAKTLEAIMTSALKAVGLAAPAKPAAKPDPKPEPGTDDQAIQTAVSAALKALGIQPVQPTAKTDPVQRPPFTFKPDKPEGDEGQNPGLKALTTLRFGETDPAIKAIATDLYGADYEQRRYEQHVAFNQYARFGREALDHKAQRALKAVILTPGQIKSYALNGMNVRALKADLSEAIDQLGGFVVPEDIRLVMIERLPGLTIVRRRADVSPTSSDVMTKVKVTGGDKRHVTPMRVTWVGDKPAKGAANTNPTFGLEKTPIHIAKCTVRVPQAVLEDTAYPLPQKIGQWSSDEYAVDEDEQFLIGNGIAKPQGVLPDGVNALALAEVLSGDANGFPNSPEQVDGLVALKYAVARQYRNNAIWSMNDTTASVIAKMKNANGDLIWHESVRAGEPPTLLGYPVETSEAMPDVAANAYPIIFGDFSGYQIADRVGMTLVRDEITENEEDIVKFIFRRRLGGQPAEEWKFAALKIAAP